LSEGKKFRNYFNKDLLSIKKNKRTVPKIGKSLVSAKTPSRFITPPKIARIFHRHGSSLHQKLRGFFLARFHAFAAKNLTTFVEVVCIRFKRHED